MPAPDWVWISAAVVLALGAAFFAAGWVAERRERAAYVETLSAAARARLAGWESVNTDWRRFRDSESADHEREASDDARADAAAKQYNAELAAADRAYEARPDIRFARAVGILRQH